MKKEGAEFDLGDLVRHISEQTVVADHSGGGEPYPEDYRIDKGTAKEVLKLAFGGISDALVEFGRVEIAGLGVFRLEPREANEWTLPDGTVWATPDRNKIVFRPSKDFVRTIAEATGTPAY